MQEMTLEKEGLSEEVKLVLWVIASIPVACVVILIANIWHVENFNVVNIATGFFVTACAIFFVSSGFTAVAVATITLVTALLSVSSDLTLTAPMLSSMILVVLTLVIFANSLKRIGIAEKFSFMVLLVEVAIIWFAVYTIECLLALLTGLMSLH